MRTEDTFLAVAERQLNAGRDAPGVEVLNLGVMGYDTPHEVALFRHVGRRYDPDLVVLCFFLNDAQGGATHSLFNVSPPAEGFLALAANHSALAARAVSALGRRRQTAQLVASYRASFENDDPHWKRARRALLEAKGLTEEDGAELVLMIFPVLFRLSSDYPFATIHDTVAAYAKAMGIPVLDLLPAFSGSDGPELWVHPTNQHPNERGHAIAGEALAGFLRERGH